MKMMSPRAFMHGLAACVLCLSGPALKAEVIADSVAEFSGLQGQNNWFYGYRDVTGDGGGLTYEYADFIAFPGGDGVGTWDGSTQLWTGSAWDMNTASAAPWTFLGQTNVHPNSATEHWAIRRWVGEELSDITSLAVTWHVRKENSGGNGVTGAVYTNGVRADSVVIAGNNTTGTVRTVYVNVSYGETIDLVLSPVGTDGQVNDGADGSFNWMTIDTTLPTVPRQPDGTVFIPYGAPDTDADGFPDVWEYAYTTNDLTQLTATGDFDSDGLTDAIEYSRGTNPTLADTDADGLADGVETGTGVFVDANDTGTDPLKVDTDGDGLRDGAEVNGPVTSNPLLTDTDADTFSDGSEVASGHNPNDASHNPNTTPIAKSNAEFSGVQGENGWFYGYRNFTSDGGGANYDPTNHFIQFPGGAGMGSWNSVTQIWTGSQWDLNTAGAAPWTELGRENVHPNGASPVHWPIRRWVASELTNRTPLAFRWHMHKSSTTCGGSGVTGGVYINGARGDSATIGGTDGVGVTRTYYANVNPGDIVDLILSPRGTDGSDADGCDGSINWMVVDPVIPSNPIQPDGTTFVPANAADSDADGLVDAWEHLYFPNDLTQLSGAGDYDQDGLTDLGEYQLGSNPTLGDTDGDGLADGVETKTGIFVSATNTGTDPTKTDTDGDGLSDTVEINANPATNPNLADTDGDTFSDSVELAQGTNPTDRNDNPLTFVIANSIAEFSGIQGVNGWFSGYRNYGADEGGVNYDPATQFLPFAGGPDMGAWDGVNQQWTGSDWGMHTADGTPWTSMGRENLHPNGYNSGGEHWAIRRWVSSELTQTTAVVVIWQVRKTSIGGSGVTGSLHVNGQQVDYQTIAGNNTTNPVRRFYLNLAPGDIIDLAHTPEGLNNDRHDGSDGSATWFWVDTRLPAIPRQPDGTVFIPVGAPDTDADGLADVWEYSWFPGDLTRLTGTGDFDNDGVSDAAEMARLTNPGAADTDNDGLTDAEESNTGVFVNETDTGTNPRKADTDNDGRLDGAEVKIQPYTNPLVADTDGDTFSDGAEVSSGHDPNDPSHNPNTTKIADSKAEFSGTQGASDWFYGYRDLLADGGANNYDPTNFIEFISTAWNGSAWDLASGSPWTEIQSEYTHPSGPDPLHWPIRRWVANELAEARPLALRYFVRKSNVDCGNGVTGAIYINGQEADKVVVPYNNGTGFTRTYYANVNPGDVIDLVLKSAGTHEIDGSIHVDYCDGSIIWMQVYAAVPPNAAQPDGTPFIPLTTPVFEDVAFTAASGQVNLTWKSVAGATYKVEATADFKTWTTLTTGLTSGGTQTSYTETLGAQRPNVRFYRVTKE